MSAQQLASGGAAAPSETGLPRTSRFLSDEIEAGLLMTGAQVCAIAPTGEVLELAVGDAGSGPVTSTTIFRVYCAIKPVTAIAIAKLVETGLSLDEPLRALLPDYLAVVDAPITLRHVLSHTAGLHRPSAFQMELMDPPERERFLRRLHIPPGWRVGVDVAYGDFFGWHLLGKVIEHVTGEPLRPYLRKSILDPLGMHETRIGMTAAEYNSIKDRIGLNYDLRGVRSFPILFERSERVCTEVNCAHGGYTTARDLAHFYAKLLAQLHGARDPALPSRDVLLQFCASVASTVLERERGDAYDYGLGFMVRLHDHFFGASCSPSSFGHAGWLGASFGFCDPDAKIAVAAVLNGIIEPAAGRLRLPALVEAVYADLGSSHTETHVGATARRP